MRKKLKKRIKRRKRTLVNMFADNHFLNSFYKQINGTLKNEKKD